MLPFCLAAVSATAATQIVIPGTSNIFGAGHTAPPPVTNWNLTQYPGADSGTLPPGVNFTPQPYLVLHVQDVSGGIAYNGSGVYAPADGHRDELNTTNLDSTAGISGLIKNNRMLFLVGVFLDNNVPVVAPPRLDATNADNVLNFFPMLGQTFFIGDGFTDSGQQQNFWSPEGATRVYFGFLDGWQFSGVPSWYSDNEGQLTMNFAMDQTAPEPAALSLVALPLAYLLWRRRKRA